MQLTEEVEPSTVAVNVRDIRGLLTSFFMTESLRFGVVEGQAGHVRAGSSWK